MRSLFSFFIASLAILATALPANAAINDFVGTWTNQDTNTGGVTKVIVKRVSGGTTVQAFGACSPNDCDWGTVNAVVYGPSAGQNAYGNTTTISAVFTKGFKETIIVLTKQGNKLKGQFLTRFTDSSGRNNYASTEKFKKMLIAIPVPGGLTLRPNEDCIGFNNNTIEVKQIGGRWKIVDGNHYIADFDNKGGEATKAFTIIKRYGFNQQCFVGRPGPSFTYWLKDGKSVGGTPAAGEDCIGFNKNNIEVKKINGRWKIVDGSHWMFDFGSNESEAKSAFAIMKYHGFSRTCYVGRPGPSMTYLLK